MLEKTTEQAEPELSETSESEVIETTDSISDILGDALKGKGDGPEDATQTEEDQAKEKTKQETVETPYGEITLDEAKKIAFKNEDEFHKFLEKNPLLKDGFLRQSDYTRKTTQVAEERKKLDELRKAFEGEQNSVWGQKKPSKEDMSFFKDFWHSFQYGSDDVAQKLASIAQDVSLIAQGKQPVGPLAGKDGATVDYTRDSELIKTRRDIDDIRAEREREKQEAQEKQIAQERAQAKTEVDSWIAEKQKQGIKISVDEFKAMSYFSSLRDDEGNRLPLDEMHRLALAKLGKTEAHAFKKVFTDTKERSKQTPSRPASRVPASAKPEPSTIEDIFSQGLEDLKA